MPFTGMVPPEQLKILSEVLDEYCKANSVFDEATKREAAARIMALFTNGFHTMDELRASLLASSSLERP